MGLRFEEIYDRYFKDVYRYVLRLSGSSDAAEEVTAETFFKALSHINSFRGECSMYTWLVRIAGNCYKTYLKKNRRTESLDGVEEPAYIGKNPEDIALDRDDAARIRRVLHTLPETYKEVFMWRVFAEMSFEEIGLLFGKTANWACVTYHRARKMIAQKEELK
ncbi:MAG: sigma-70 family RNA polymerase sigma factor [Clostridiales bacterium]|nr:sigma-70 family RNA polymerase sigma factor [Clostridiales bacterium]